MKLSSLNDYLNVNNVWTKRLLGYENFERRRNLEQVEREYNQDKYKKLLDVDLKTVQEYKIIEFGKNPSTKIHISLKDEIFETSWSSAKDLYDSTLVNLLKKYESDYYCELECGYGYNLTKLNGKVYGGEYSSNAVKLAKKLGLEVYEFNYYNAEDYSILKNSTTLFTSHSIEQLPDASCFIEGLLPHRSKLNFIINVEPSYFEDRSNFIGLLRNKYIKLNDYNRNLFSIIKQREDIEILEYQKDAIGINPLNPANIIVWRFK